MSLASELWQVVEEREDPGPWLRRALLAADAWGERSGLKTWYVERGTYLSVLLAAVAAQHWQSLGATPALQALRDVAALVLALVALLYGAELDSIGAREREQAEAEGREPVRVECSPRAAEVRAAMPWLGLAALAFTFGWVGAVALGWRTAYPHWRRWYRSHRPLGRAPATAVTDVVLMANGDVWERSPEGRWSRVRRG